MKTPQLVALSRVKLGRILWLRTDKVNSRGFCPVSLRLTLPGHKHADMGTGVSCRPADWLGPAGKEGPLKPMHLEYEADTHRLQTLRLNAKTAQQRLEALGRPVTPQAVVAVLRNPKVLEASLAPCLLEFMEAEVETHYKAKNRGTYEAVRAIVHKLRSWAGEGRLPLEELPPRRALAFYEYLLAAKARGGEITTANKAIVNVEALFRRGSKYALWAENENPFACITKKTPPRRLKSRLTNEELHLLLRLDLAPQSSLWRARAAYLLQFYLRGERIGACLLLRWADVKGKGTRIEYQAQKGGPFKQLAVRGELAELLGTLREHQATGKVFVLPYLPDRYGQLDSQQQLTEIKKATSLINKGLKQLMALADIDKPLTTHAARRTFATLAHKVAGIGATQKMLGHTTEAMTRKYLAEFDADELDQTANSIFDSLAGPSATRVVPMWEGGQAA